MAEISYANSLSKLTEVGKYPHHITSANEGRSQSVDGSTIWNFINWQQGKIKFGHDDSTEGTEFNFHSIKNNVFHSLRLLEQHHTDCLKCLLQIFSHQKPITSIQPKLPIPNYATTLGSVSSICEQAIAKITPFNKLKVDILTEGGMVSKNLSVNDLEVSKNYVRLLCDRETSLDLYATSISSMHTSQVGDEIQTAFLNSNGTPQTTLRICA
jgi:hypothetical protein